MKVLWVADFSINHNFGGAQQTNQRIIDAGKKRGHDIVEFNYDTPLEVMNDNYDVVVSNNLDVFNRRQHPILEYIPSHDNHIRFEHDRCTYLNSMRRRAIFGSAKRTFFLCEYHHRQHEQEYKMKYSGVDYITPYVEQDKFYDYGNEREDKVLHVGFLHWLKGALNLKRYILDNPEKEFVVVGWADSKKLEFTFQCLPNVTWVGKVNNSELPDIYNRYTELFFHPFKHHSEAWCRTLAEGMFCGINITCRSDRVGVIHDLEKYGLEKLKEMSNNAPTKFWEIIE